jgi:hypothetical protein
MRKQAMRFLVELSMDPLMRESFQRNPLAALESAGITDEEAKAVLGSGSATQIGSYVGSTKTEDDPPPVLILVMT